MHITGMCKEHDSVASG